MPLSDRHNVHLFLDGKLFREARKHARERDQTFTQAVIAALKLWLTTKEKRHGNP
jgi:hypothetical protein